MRSLMIVGVLAAVSLAGCGKIPVPTIRAYHDAVGKPFVRYMEADATLTADQKRIRKQTVDSFERLLQQAEK